MAKNNTPDDTQPSEELSPNVYTSKILLSKDDFDFIERLNEAEPPKLDWLQLKYQ